MDPMRQPRRHVRAHPREEIRYFITSPDVDKLHSAGVNTLRIPTTYAMRGMGRSPRIAALQGKLGFVLG